MQPREKYLLLKTVQDNNILPITSVCNMRCKFCSHQYNPEDVEIYSFGHLDLALIRELITYLPSEGPVILGESATRVIEGEPFSHPEIRAILRYLRNEFPEKEIRITTNGSYLTTDMLELLDLLQPIELNISLNSANPDERVFLMGDKKPERVFKGISSLSNFGIEYNGSIVAMPHLLGWESIRETIKFLCKNGVKIIRIFRPGFTSLTPPGLTYGKELIGKLKNFVEEMNSKYKTPIILEPPPLNDFIPRIKGIIEGTPADQAGFKQGDIIANIEGNPPLTAVDAFQKLKNIESPEVEIIRKGEKRGLVLKKSKSEISGVVMDYDLDPDVYLKLRDLIDKYRNKKIIIATSVLARSLFTEFVNREGLDNVRVVSVKNNFFGGSIKSAGLLVKSDILQAIRKIPRNNIDVIFLPGIFFDSFGNDLTGSNCINLGEELNLKIKFIEV